MTGSSGEYTYPYMCVYQSMYGKMMLLTIATYPVLLAWWL